MNKPNLLGSRITQARLCVLLCGLVSWACADRSVHFDDVPPTGNGGADADAGSAGTFQYMGHAGSHSSGGAANAGSGSGGGTSGGDTAVAGQAPVGGASAAGTGGTDGGASSAGAVGLGGSGGPMGGAAQAGGGGTSAGAGGSAPVRVLDVIDDVEGAFPSLPGKAGRNGGWYLVHDDSGGTVAPPSAFALQPARGTSHYAALVNGGGFTDWGAELGVALTSPIAAYDASAYCGVHFMAKGSGASWTMLISDRLSDPLGGVCVPDSWDVTQQCYDYVGAAFAPSADWQSFDLSFAALAPMKGYTGKDRKLDASGLYDIVFSFSDGNGAPFELLVDDLSFIEKTTTGCP